MRKDLAKKTNTKKQKEQQQATNFSVFDHLTDGFYAIDEEWRYIYVNDVGARLAQVAKKDMLGKRMPELFADAYAIDFGKALKSIKKDGKPRTVEAFYPRHNKWYEDTFFPIPEGIGILARDITDRKQAEIDQRRLAAIVSTSDDAIVSKNLDSIVTSWNTAAEKMFGYTAQEMIGRSIRTIIPPELQKEEDEILAKLRKGQRIDHFETTRVTKDGRRLKVSVTISPIKNSKGQVIGASKIARDVTLAKQTETNLKFLAQASKELAASLDYEKTLANVAHLAVPHIADWCSIEILDKAGVLQQVAIAHKDPKQVKWAKALRKKTPPDMQSKTGIPNVIHAGKTEVYPYIDDAMLVQSARDEKELALLRKMQLTSVIITPIFSNNKPIGAISFITTESRKRFTDADVRMAEELATRASLAIENARLYQEMQKELTQRKKLEKQKDEFIGVASHELKTPVTSIKSFAQILQYRFKKEGRETEAELLGKLDAQIDKLTSLIGDLLDVTKIEAGRMVFNEGSFAFDELVTETVEEMQRTTERHTLRIVGKTKKELFGDRERLGQVIVNLISNAIKYSPYTKEIIINSSVEKGMVKLCVQDFGVGIAKDKQDKIFDRFFRVSGPGKETYPGLGLGLYISSEIIKRMQGKIWVESIEGKGSTFCFYLPLKPKKSKEKKQRPDEFTETAIKHE
jgi:PAS domain S-box-containing protein